MKRNPIPYVLVALFLLATVMAGCDGPGADGDDGGQGTSALEGNGGGTSTIRGTITSFETAGRTFVPVEQEEEGFLSRTASWISEALVSSAYAAGNREGIIVTLTGPVNGTTTTAADGTFVFSGLLAGAYALQFEYDGEQVRYRGRSGQEPTITLEEDQVVDLVLRISGGKVNIGNITVMPAGDSE